MRFMFLLTTTLVLMSLLLAGLISARGETAQSLIDQAAFARYLTVLAFLRIMRLSQAVVRRSP